MTPSVASVYTALFGGAVTFCAVLAGQSTRPPRIWDDAALAEWATPIASLNVRPGHYSSADYYAAPEDNFRTYPVYHPDSEPPGYWEDLQKRTPEPLVDASRIRTRADWIAAGERAFREMDAVLERTSDPAVIAMARDPGNFKGVLKLRDGAAFGPRWVVTPTGVQLGFPACGGCHFSLQPDGTVRYAGPGGPVPAGTPPINPRGIGGAAATLRGLRSLYIGDTFPMFFWRQWTVPWALDERIEKIRSLSGPEIQRLLAGQTGAGVFPRVHGSPFFATKVPDLRLLRYYRYIDATGTHRLRGPEDVARYAALITGTDPMDFGPHRILTDEQRRVRFRYADEVLYAIGVYLLSLEPPRNPKPAPADVVKRGEQIYRREGCVDCHVPPAYTSGLLTLAHGWKPEPSHPNYRDVNPVSVSTDPGLALKTRKGTGFYKIPSLRGVWYRPRLLHDASFASLEEMFDPARTRPGYLPKGWNPPGVTARPVLGHQFGVKLDAEEKAALLAFLRSL
jgi:hypothetical protein